MWDNWRKKKKRRSKVFGLSNFILKSQNAAKQTRNCLFENKHSSSVGQKCQKLTALSLGQAIQSKNAISPN